MRLAAACAGAALVLSLAVAPAASAAVTTQTITGSSSPLTQQPVTRGPATATFGWATAYDTPTSPTPAMSEAEFHFENDFVFNQTGITQCDSFNSTFTNADTAEAIAFCPNSQIGSGTATFTGGAPCQAGCTAVVTAFAIAFNPSAVPPQTGAVALHIYNGSGDLTRVVRMGLTASGLGGEFLGGTRFRTSVIPTLVPSVLLTNLSVTLGNATGAQDDNYVKARCNDDDQTWDFEGFFNFSSAQTFSRTDEEPCTQNGKTLTVGLAGTGSGTVTGPGISCPTNCVEHLDTNSSSGTLTATASPGSTFTGWTGCDVVSGVGGVDCTMTMDVDETPTATFDAIPGSQQLTVTTGGAGTGTVTSSPTGISCPGQCDHVFQENQIVTLTPTPTNGSSFTSWGGDCTGSGACQVTMSAARTVSANFAPQPPQRTLTVSKTGTGYGTITSLPAGINCPGQCVDGFDENSVVTLTANPIGGSTFSGWGGACTGTATCQLTMDAAKSVSAGFVIGSTTFEVDTTVDAADANATADGICATSTDDCSLRAAVFEANATPITDTITFTDSSGVYSAAVGASGTFIMVSSPVTITGNGSGATGTRLSGTDQRPVLNIAAASGQVTLRDLRIQNGRLQALGFGSPPAAPGGGINIVGAVSPPTPSVTLEDVTVTDNDVVATAPDSLGIGGGIFVGPSASLSLIESTVSGNTASGVGVGAGGGIYARGSVTATDSTISGNQVVGGTTQAGGGMASDLFGSLTLTRSTVNGNSTGAAGGGGGIAMGGFGSTEITNSTISGNTAGSAGGGGLFQNNVFATVSAATFASNSAPGGVGADVFSSGSGTTAKSTIFGSPSACAISGSGSITSAGRNLDVGTSCGFGTANGNFQNTNPLLEPLANNGGPTSTRALQVGSPAIDTGSAVAATDQRGAGFARPQGAGCDIGAFELTALNDAASCVETSAPVPTPTPVPSDSGAKPKPKCKKGQKLKKGKCVKAKKPKKKK